MEAAIDHDSEDDNDDSECILPEGLEDEIDINIHFHCEHCFNFAKCNERSKPGWCCDIIDCVNGCGHRFHQCKSEEHELICSHVRVRCLNYGNGCPHFIQRQHVASHLPECPASVIVCNAEWNRWAFGSRERERVSVPKGTTANYDYNDLDMSLAIDDQRLVNEMHSQPKYLRKILCNDMTKRFPCLPLTVRGSVRDDYDSDGQKKRSRSQSTTDDDEEGLTPGLSLSVCTKLLRGTPHKETFSNSPKELKPDDTLDPDLISNLSLNSGWSDSGASKLPKTGTKQRNDDISAFCCSHGIIKDLCHFCRNDPDEPAVKYANVWREKINLEDPGVMEWSREQRVEKIRKRNTFGTYVYKRVDESDEEENEDDEEESGKERSDATAMTTDSTGRPIGRFRFQTPPPVQLTPKGLILEIVLKHYSRHQVKPKAMFTFQCMKEMRRDEFLNHYKNVHSEIQEGLEGWLIERCPMNIIGCPFSLTRLHPQSKDRDVIFCHTLRTFGVRTNSEVDGSHKDSRFLSTEKNQSRIGAKAVMGTIPEHPPAACEKKDVPFMASSCHITFLPVEILRNIARYLDGFSLNNLSLTCNFMRDICWSLLNEKGLVIQEWVRHREGSKVSWKLGRNRWFFPKSFEYVPKWVFSDGESMSNHLSKCPFNIRFVSEEKFCYSHLRREEIRRFGNTPKQ
ncbi:F-box only protein 30 [Armadillidium nasatum]|uniref:F-box only protein 30 n=1 Tax=Armadillidium nasatum TaxID=96803 RepID=A0A5N5SH94_9CRUS|nr:F-box only protein 30 [Armadillidium nasatum]